MDDCPSVILRFSRINVCVCVCVTSVRRHPSDRVRVARRGGRDGRRGDAVLHGPGEPGRRRSVVLRHRTQRHARQLHRRRQLDRRHRGSDSRYTTTLQVNSALHPSDHHQQTVDTHTYTHPFYGPFSRTTQVSRYQKGKTNLDFTEARDSEWQWHQLGDMQVCTSLQTDDHASTSPLSFLQAGCPSCRPTNSVKALKARALKSKALYKCSVCFTYFYLFWP